MRAMTPKNYRQATICVLLSVLAVSVANAQSSRELPGRTEKEIKKTIFVEVRSNFSNLPLSGAKLDCDLHQSLKGNRTRSDGIARISFRLLVRRPTTPLRLRCVVQKPGFRPAILLENVERNAAPELFSVTLEPRSW